MVSNKLNLTWQENEMYGVTLKTLYNSENNV